MKRFYKMLRFCENIKFVKEFHLLIKGQLLLLISYFDVNFFFFF